ncbi:MAG: Gfo/Idh/MocA family oxidoreductase [Rhodothermia bacterium]|nr:Gfo/Idh/MocA family oxidoreductase [Rhodothermia bacterium]
MKKIRWGILSTGRIAHKFASDFRHAEGGELVAVASRSKTKADAFAQEYEIPKAFVSYQQMIESPDIDAVYIATPHTLHLENTLDAFEADKAVLCEKPLTVTPDECRKLIDRARDRGCYVMEAMWTYFLPAVQKAREWVEAGRIGTVRHVKADFGFRVPYDPDTRLYNVELGGGVMLDMGIYPIAIAWHFMRSDPDHVEVIARKAPNGVEDDVVVLYKYADATASLSASFRCTLPNRAFIIGEGGFIELPDFWCARECRLFDRNGEVDRFRDERTSLGLNYETTAVNRDLLNGRSESEIMPLETSLVFQRHIADVLRHATIGLGPHRH